MEAGGKQAIYHWKKLWETWDLRVVILFSLFLQIFLIFSAPLRKRTANSYIIIPMWLAYSLADGIANFAVGLISRSPGNISNPSANLELLAFWVPFLLLHLGGPDTITAFALEDNELWLRHLLQLVFQCGTAAYVFVLTLSFKNKLWLPTLLVFVAGFIKYTERTRSLNLASWHRFRDSLMREPDPGPNYDKLMDEYFSKKEAQLPTKIKYVPGPRRNPEAIHEDRIKPLKDLDVVVHAYQFFQTFKGLFADLIFSFRERDKSRAFFLHRTAGDAFKVVEVELNFLYEMLYTKVKVVQGKYGYTLRFVSFILIMVALVLFYFIDKDSRGFRKIDVELTYTLLFSAIALDIIALPMLLFSDWTTATHTEYGILRKSLSFIYRKMWFKDSTTQHSTYSFGWFMQILQRRWCERISQYNLIRCCLHPHSPNKKKIIGYLGLTDILHRMKYVKKERFSMTLRDFIFNELREKSLMAEDIETAKDICSAKGDWILRIEGCDSLLPYILETDYDECLILWHMATELCYNTDKVDDRNKDFSKLLSDYMLYLLIIEPTMISAVAGIGQIRFRDTCAEAEKFLHERNIRKRQDGKQSKQTLQHMVAEACKSILSVNTEVKPVTVKGDRSKSLLFDACILAKELDHLEEGKKWEIISKVWVELLSYAACRCRASNHAAQLSKGGQLITLVWLLMTHLGLGYQFQISEGHPRLKIVVEK